MPLTITGQLVILSSILLLKEELPEEVEPEELLPLEEVLRPDGKLSKEELPEEVLPEEVLLVELLIPPEEELFELDELEEDPEEELEEDPEEELEEEQINWQAMLPTGKQTIVQDCPD